MTKGMAAMLVNVITTLLLLYTNMVAMTSLVKSLPLSLYQSSSKSSHLFHLYNVKGSIVRKFFCGRCCFVVSTSFPGTMEKFHKNNAKQSL